MGQVNQPLSKYNLIVEFDSVISTSMNIEVSIIAEKLYSVASRYEKINKDSNWESDISDAMKSVLKNIQNLEDLKTCFYEKSQLNKNIDELCAGKIFEALEKGCE